ncbi:alpha-tocopherol transfer protein-like, partial [Hyposmocoma kahamanoa]|uniref:alpha-tocopherol transfer protein-like n=1 Tax=Hyposmocoma kahamanoa TaxID=1477025 RepID=UPI000E6D6485
DMMIKKFLHSCYGSLERTKKCIERFCTTRSNMPEVYTCRDPTSDKMKDAFSITNVSTYLAGDNELLIHQLNDPELEKFNYYDVLKSFAIQADYWLKVHEVFPEGHIIILDIKDYTLKILPKINVLFFKDFLLFLLEGMPVRVKGVHVINCPSYYEMLYGLVKPVLPADIRSLIQFHGTPEGVHKHIDPKYIPEEYGGSASSMTEQHNSWVRDIQKNRYVLYKQ